MTASAFCSTRLERVFDATFAAYNTRLIGGFAEPIYLPAGSECAYHRLCYRDDYFASALHESAHWCIAGPERRLQEDFGYWYAPDGRDARAQRAFEQVEVKPQALEWWFTQACGATFSLSVDNLDATGDAAQASDEFVGAVSAQARRWQAEGLPERAAQFFAALCDAFGQPLQPAALDFSIQALG